MVCDHEKWNFTIQLEVSIQYVKTCSESTESNNNIEKSPTSMPVQSSNKHNRNVIIAMSQNVMKTLSRLDKGRCSIVFITDFVQIFIHFVSSVSVIAVAVLVLLNGLLLLVTN